MSRTDRLDPSRAAALAALPAAELEREIEALVCAGADAVPLLQALERGAGDKELRKRLRRALHQLKSQGVEIESARRSSGGSVLRPLEQAQEVGLLAPPVALGVRLLFLVSPARGAAHVHEILLDAAAGLRGLRRYEVRRREARSFVRAARSSAETPLLEVSGSEIRALVRRAEAARQGLVPAAIDRDVLRELLAGAVGPTPGERLRAERSALAPLSGAPVEATLQARMESGACLPWLFEGPEIEALAGTLAQVEQSPLVLSETQKRERRSEQLSSSAARILDPGLRERLATHLEETAVFLDRAGDVEGVQAALQIAERIRSAERPLDVHFVRSSLELSLEAALRRRTDDEPERLILPG